MNMAERVARAMWPNVYAAMDNDALTAIGGPEVLRVAKEKACRQARTAIAAMRDPTEAMEDAARGAWLWYAGLPHDNKWTFGQQNKAGGYKLSLTDDEASAVHLPKHIMGRICWRTQIDTALSEPEGVKE